MGRTAAMATVLLMVLLTTSAGLVSPAGSASTASVADDPASDAVLTDGDDALADTTMPPVPVDNSTARLVLPEEEIERSGMVSMQPDLGGALANAGEDVHRRHDYLVTDVRFDDASSDDEREVVIDQTLIDLKDDAVAMRERQRLAIARYANGTIDEPELLRTLARIDRSARRMLETTDYLESETNQIGLKHRIYEVEGILGILKGPVRGEARRTLNAGGETRHFYVEATDTALVLSTVDDDGTFFREAYVPSNRGEGPSRKVEDTWNALKLSAEYYPWVGNNTAGTEAVNLLNDVYEVRLPHVQGETTAYLDAYSSDVFYETQRLDVDSMPTSPEYEVTKDGLEIVVHRIYPGGPIIVGVYDEATGNHVNARVSVADVEVGPTDDQSLVRAVEPRAEYEISVRTSLVSTNVTVDPKAEE